MRKLFKPINLKKIALAIFGIGSALYSDAQVDVVASGGTPAGTYVTLKEAFDAINAGTHTGNIAIGISANTTETASAVLNSSGAGAASYTAILISPTNDGVSVSGPTTTGRGLIELKGADNVTINGDNPNTAGTNRDLTIRNTASNTTTLTSVIVPAAVTIKIEVTVAGAPVEIATGTFAEVFGSTTRFKLINESHPLIVDSIC
jgi:hypothetical protein